jgi:hypothetical protein
MHVHVGAMEAVVFLLMLIIVGAGWRLGASHLAQSDNPTAQVFGQAMAFIF